MSNSRPRVLVLAANSATREKAQATLCEHFDLEVFADVEQAMAALRSNDFCAVFADVGDFLPLERALIDRQASMVLNTIGEGVCIVDDQGECVWANHKMRHFPPEVYERVKQTCASALTGFTGSRAEAGDESRMRSRKYGFQVGTAEYYEAIVSPVLDDSGAVHQVVAVTWDASTGRRLQQKLDAIDMAGRELVRLEAESLAKLTAADRLQLLEVKIIRYVRELMDFDHFCIRLLNKQSNLLEVVIAAGLPPEALEVDIYAQPEGNGISGYVAATGRSYICHDVEKDPRYVIGLDHAKSSLTVPLRLHDKVIGVFNIEGQEPGSFNEDDRQLAEIFGRHIAVALNILDLLVVERFTTSGRLADDVVREMAGPLNDIITEAQTLIEEYIGNDDMRRRLGKIVDDVASVREVVKHVAEGPRRVLGVDEVHAEIDPLLAGKRILVADDEPNIRETICNTLQKFGCQTIECKDGHDAVVALEQSRSENVDLIISDIRMPHRNGYEIFAAARRIFEGIPVILMTGFGYDPHHSIVRASQEGLQVVLFKPFKVEQLMEEVRKAFEPESVPEQS